MMVCYGLFQCDVGISQQGEPASTASDGAPTGPATERQGEPLVAVSRLWHALWTKATRCELGIHVVLLSVRCLDCLSYCRVQYPLRPFSFSWSFGSSLQSLSPIDAVIWWRPFEDVARGRNGPQGPDESVRPGAKRGTMNSKRIHIDSLNPSGLLSFLGAPIDIYIYFFNLYL